MKFVERMAMSTLKVSDVIVFFQRGGLFHWIYDNGSIQSTGKSLFLEKVESFLILIEYTHHMTIFPRFFHLARNSTCSTSGFFLMIEISNSDIFIVICLYNIIFVNDFKLILYQVSGSDNDQTPYKVSSDGVIVCLLNCVDIWLIINFCVVAYSVCTHIQ